MCVAPGQDFLKALDHDEYQQRAYGRRELRRQGR